MNITIRTASPADAGRLLAIYAPYITDTVITFEYDVPTEEQFRQRMAKVQQRYPWLVAEADGEIIGYAYASQFKDRAAYDWAVETSIYVEKDRRHSGVGRLLHSSAPSGHTEHERLPGLLGARRRISAHRQPALPSLAGLRAGGTLPQMRQKVWPVVRHDMDGKAHRRPPERLMADHKPDAAEWREAFVWLIGLQG